MTSDELRAALRKIHCSGMEQALESRLQQVQADDLRPLDLLELLVYDEMDCRRERSLQRRLRRARFRDVKSLDEFDWNFNKQIDRRIIFELATCKFVQQKLSVVMCGNSGTGKSHLVQAIGYAAIHANYNVLYKEILLLNDELMQADLRGEEYHSAFVKKFSEPDLLIGMCQ